MTSVIQVDDQVEGSWDKQVVEFPHLKTLSLQELPSIISFCSTSNATLSLPSLESLSISECKKMPHFWSGTITAPRLFNIDIVDCGSMECLQPGNTDHHLHLPCLERLSIALCPNMHSFSSAHLRPAHITKIYYNYHGEEMQVGEINSFLLRKSSHGKETSASSSMTQFQGQDHDIGEK